MSAQHLVYCGLGPVYPIPPAAPHPNSCHGDQALIPSEYSDHKPWEVYPLGGGWNTVPFAPYRACACACAWTCWPAPCFPILSLCFLPPKPQVPGSEVEMWLARQGTSRARRPRGLHLGWGPFRSVGTGGCARIDDAAFHFPMPPLPPPALARPASPSALCQQHLAALASLAPWFSLVLGPGSSFTNLNPIHAASTNTGTHPVTGPDEQGMYRLARTTRRWAGGLVHA